MVWLRKDRHVLPLSYNANTQGPIEKEKWVPKYNFVFDVGTTSKTTRRH